MNFHKKFSVTYRDLRLEVWLFKAHKGRLDMKRNLLGFLIAVGTFLVGGFAVSLLVYVYMPAHGGHTAASDSYAVYSVVLEDERYASRQYVVDFRTSINNDLIGPVGYSHPGLDAATIADFRSGNESAIPLMASYFDSDKNIQLFNSEESGDVFGGTDGSWNVFFHRFPDAKGLIALSNVGFNPARTQALVHVGLYCGRACGGGGNFVLLKKEYGSWVIQHKYHTWSE